MANHWHYQLMKHSDGTVAIHEYFPLDDGDAWTEEPVTVFGDDIDDLRRSLMLMLLDIERHGVKEYTS